MTNVEHIPEQWQNISQLFVALGDAQRQRILLAFEKDERLNIGQIVTGSKLSRTAVTHHLNVLRNGGALQSEKVGKEVYFWINKSHIMTEIQNVLEYIKNEI